MTSRQKLASLVKVVNYPTDKFAFRRWAMKRIPFLSYNDVDIVWERTVYGTDTIWALTS